jgi:hypothetical protein
MEIPSCLVWRRRKISDGRLCVLRNTLPAVYFLATSGPPKFNEPLYRLSELFLSKGYWRTVTCWPGALPNERVSFKYSDLAGSRLSLGTHVLQSDFHNDTQL